MHAGYPIGDAIGGLFGAVSVLAACWKRARDPAAPGEEIDLSLCEATLRILDFLPIEYDQTGVVRGRSGNKNQYSAPSAVYRTRDDQWVTLSGSTNAMFANNCRAIDRPELTSDTRFRNNGSRCDHAAELNSIFSDWCERHDLTDVLEAFTREDGTLAPINSIDQIFADPQMIARDAITSVADRDFGFVRMQNVVPRFANDPGFVKWTAGDIGQDNSCVLGDRLGLSSAELEKLRQSGVI